MKRGHYLNQARKAFEILDKFHTKMFDLGGEESEHWSDDFNGDESYLRRILEGPMGKDHLNMDINIFELNINEGKEVSIKPKVINQHTKRIWGLNRSLINNAIIGINQGYSKTLELTGVGFRAAVKGNLLNQPQIFGYRY